MVHLTRTWLTKRQQVVDELICGQLLAENTQLRSCLMVHLTRIWLTKRQLVVDELVHGQLLAENTIRIMFGGTSDQDLAHSQPLAKSMVKVMFDGSSDQDLAHKRGNRLLTNCSIVSLLQKHGKGHI